MLAASATPLPCPLCEETERLSPQPGQDKRRYYHCHACQLVFVHPADRITPEAEQERYLTHKNGPHNAGHVNFLMNAIEPALPHLRSGASGLDYGCGHVPTLSVLMQDRGFPCADYDRYFFPELPSGPFDFIFATETIEHFTDPGPEFAQLFGLLKPGGIFTAMTLFWKTPDDFLRHFYYRDTTHFVFYHADTMAWLAQTYELDLLYTDDFRVMVFRKRS